MTARRKAFIALLGIGLVALAADQLIPRSENSADEPEPQLAVAQAPAAQKTPQAAPAPANPALSQRIARALERSTGQEQTRDIFLVPLAWIGPQKVEQVVAAPAPRTPRFDETHRLTALILNGDRSGALIDGMMVKVGESIDGYRLMSVANNVAVFESANERAFVRVEKSAVAAVGNQPEQ